MAEGGSFGSAFRDNLERYARGPDFANMVGPANASANAQQTGDGLGIQNIRRGVARAAITTLGANITVTATSHGALSTRLTLDMFLSGRPLEVTLSGIAAAGSGGELSMDVLLRGTSITGTTNGLLYTAATDALQLTGHEIVLAPAPGRATLEVVAKRGIADGTIFVTSDRLVLTAKEL